MLPTALDVHNHFRGIGPWVDWEGRTPDGFKAGDPHTPVRGIAVGWQSMLSSLHDAHARGCNLFITHEPTYYSHMDDDEALRGSPPAQRKNAFLRRTGMVIYRCHDVWDIYPRLGIVDAWSEFLELGEPVARSKYYALHRVPRTMAWELVRRIGRRVATLGEQSVRFIGRKTQMVQRLAVGTGAITNVRQMVELGADIVLTTDDGIRYWGDGAYAADLGLPVMVVNHMTAEIPGLRRLVEYLRTLYPGLPVEFVGPTCGYEIAATELSRDTPIRMRLDRLDDLPPIVVPDGYVCRPMAPEETWAYIKVMNLSNFAGECDEAWLARTFSDDPLYDPSYCQILWKGGEPVAAATGWHMDLDGQPWGLIHWVGVTNTERSVGLGKAVTLAAMHKLKQRGFTRALLNTSVWRLPAVATYLRLGFRPWPTDTAPQSVWNTVLADLAAWREVTS